MLWRAEAVARVCSVKKVFLKVSQYAQENTCAGVFFNKVADIQLATLSKRDSNTDFSQCILVQNFKTRSSKYTFGWLLLIEGWISLKMAPIALAINISNASYQREFVFFSYLRSAYGKFVEISKSFCLLNFNESQGTVFSSKLSFFFFH